MDGPTLDGSTLDDSAATRSGPLEWALVRAAASVDITPESAHNLLRLLQRPVDWEAALRLADHHGTSALLHRNLSQLDGVAELVPAAALCSLRQFAERNVHKSLFLARELIRILDCLDALGIEAIPYKGIVLSEFCYGDMALRQAGDMDFFIRKRDLARIKTAVGDLGYTARVFIADAAERDYIASGYECTFDSPAGKNLLEMQWALQPHYYAVDFDMDGLFARAVNASLAGRCVRTPSPEDLLARAFGACVEARVGTADLAVRHCSDFEAGQSELGGRAFERPQAWH